MIEELKEMQYLSVVTKNQSISKADLFGTYNSVFYIE